MKTMYAGVLMMAAAMGAGAQSLAQVESGSVRGANGAAVDRFLGIPYAQAPVGDLRWRDPLPAKKWDAVRDATRASAACQQAAPTEFGPYTSEFLNGPAVSEDCLYLNVWRPHGAMGRLPVYVFIHGPATLAGKTFGAFHTSEVPYVMGVLDAKGRTFTAQDRAVSNAMQDRWVAFIKTGNPGVAEQAWAPAGSKPVVMGLGDTTGPRQAVSTPARLQAFIDFTQAGGTLTLF